MADDRSNLVKPEDAPRLIGSAREIVDRYTHCQFCGANLHFKHITDFSRNLTHEQANCLECGVKSQQITHRLH